MSEKRINCSEVCTNDCASCEVPEIAREFSFGLAEGLKDGFNHPDEYIQASIRNLLSRVDMSCLEKIAKGISKEENENA